MIRPPQPCLARSCARPTKHLAPRDWSPRVPAGIWPRSERSVFLYLPGSTICSHGYCHLLHVGLPVRVGSHVVRTGQLLHGDENGVTDIPIDLADEVADAAADFVVAEKNVLDYMQGDREKTVGTAAALLKELGQAVGDIKKRVSRARR